MRAALEGLIGKLAGYRRLPCYVVSHEPLVVAAFWDDFYRHQAELARALAQPQRAYFLFKLGYECESAERVAQVAGQFEQSVARYPYQYRFLCNTQKEADLLGARGIRTIYCNHNAFLDERRYPILRRRKRYDALYLARFTPCKRHHLAALVPRLRLVGDYYEFEREYYEASRRLLAHARWTRRVRAWRVPGLMAQARTGLCLSEREGAMYASAEYLLCGLPVVSTPSTGGRDVFFDDPWVRIVEPSAEAVAAGVAELIERRLRPEDIRQAVLDRMWEHRRRFLDCLREIFAEQGVRFPAGDAWSRFFVHKLGLRCSVVPPTALRGLVRRPW